MVGVLKCDTETSLRRSKGSTLRHDRGAYFPSSLDRLKLWNFSSVRNTHLLQLNGRTV